MPLGVDHETIASEANASYGVRKPLMPLGVDHTDAEALKAAQKSAKTFDAIRR